MKSEDRKALLRWKSRASEAEARAKELESENERVLNEYNRLLSPLTTPMGERIHEACSDLGLFGVRGSIFPYREDRQRLEQIIELAQKATGLERERNEQRDRIRQFEAGKSGEVES